MTSYQRGGIADLRVTFLDRPDGVPTDPTAIQLRILDGATVVDGPWTYPGMIVRELLGLYSYGWAIPEDLPLGTYTAEWTATINAVVRTGYELLTVIEGSAVIPGQPMSWTTTSQVMAVTGVDVSGAQILQAQQVIETFAGITFATSDLSARNLRVLSVATAYQAAWMVGQIDLPTRTDIKEITQDGVRITPANPDALLLAPLAARALAQLSWRNRRTTRLKSGRVRFPTHEAFAAAWMRDEVPGERWSPA